MRIGIDISQIVYKTGVSKYTLNLVRNLVQLESDHEFVLFAGALRQKAEITTFLSGLEGKFESKVVPLPPKFVDLLWNRLHIGRIERFTGNLDLFHSSDWAQPPSQAKKVTTVHDLSPILYPEQTPKSIVSVFSRKLYWVKKEVDLIIVPSEQTKLDLINLGFSEGNVRVIYEAANYSKPLEASNKIKGKYKIAGNYALAVGVHPRKNTKRIIAAFQKATAGKDMKLVLVGHPTGIEITDDRNLRFTGRVESDADMNALYSGASVVVYPSLYEGFGIPILDSFSCQTPVVTSNLGSMREVAGDAAVLVDPTSVDSIADGIKEALAKPKTYIAKGLKRADYFSWEKMAKGTLKVYEELK